MKRLLAALAVLCAAGWFTPASAANYANTPRWVLQDLRSIQTAVPAVRDSEFVCGATARMDTTAAMLLADCHAGIPPNPRAGTAVDSTDWLVFYWIPNNVTGDPTISADSIYLQTQVSLDGTNWQLVTPTISFQVTNSVFPPATGGFVLESNATNGFARAYKMAWAATGQHQTAFVGTAPTDNQLWGFNYVRWIIGTGNDGCYRAKVGHWTVADTY